MPKIDRPKTNRPKINRAWHEARRMPKNPTDDQRIAWHLDHARNCGCRKIDGRLAELMTRRGIPIPVFTPEAG